MLESLSRAFINIEALPQDGYGTIQIAFLAIVYFTILKYASGLITYGAKLLLLIPPLAGFVGTVVLPVVSVIPCGAIIFFSGIGPLETIQDRLSVGVGALVGSTIMTLTVPWALTVWNGRVSIVDGVCNYIRPRDVSRRDFCKLLPQDETSLFRTGIHPYPHLRMASYIMLASTIGYLAIQIPAFRNPHITADHLSPEQVRREHPFAFVSLACCILGFVGYMWYNVSTADDNIVIDAEVLHAQERALRAQTISLRGLFGPELRQLARESRNRSSSERSSLRPMHVTGEFRRLLRLYFTKYDTSRRGVIDVGDIRALLNDFNMRLADHHIVRLMHYADTDGNGEIDFDALLDGFRALLAGELTANALAKRGIRVDTADHPDAAGGAVCYNDDEEADMPEDGKEPSADDQRRHVLLLAMASMAAGALLVALFSAPMVAVLADGGRRFGLSGFYAAFLLAPFAGNFDEMMTNVDFAARRTRQSCTVSLQQFVAVATIHNTLSLGIFLCVVYLRHLPWVFTAETISILIVEVAIAGVAQQRLQRPGLAVFVLALYPLAFLFVWSMENILHLN